MERMQGRYYLCDKRLERYQQLIVLLDHSSSRHSILRLLKSKPKEFYQHLRHVVAATVIKVTYGLNVKEENDSFVELVREGLIGYSTAGSLGRFWVDIVPFLRYIPKWVPGASFQSFAAYYRPLGIAMKDVPWQIVKDEMRAGTAPPSVSASMLEKISSEKDPEEEEISKNCAGIAFGGGADTTTSALHSFIMAMVLYPEVQKKAQAELDAVVGPNRLPEFADRSSLPYIQALIKEALRWQMVTPCAVPHLTSEDDEYKGYFIPKGAVVVGNAWSLLHDPVEFPNPEEFRPDRFLKDGSLDPSVRDPETACFGFGRRICPGKAMAVNSLYTTIACILHCFDITPSIDSHGNPIPIQPEMTSGVISFMTEFSCSVKPRSVAHEALIDSFVDC